MTMRTLMAAAFLMSLLAGLPAQDTRPADAASEAALSKAILIEESEHDASAAQAEYRKLASDAKVAAAVRARALGRLVALLGRQGKLDAERDALLRAASELGDPAASVVRVLRGEPTDEQERMKDRVGALDMALRRAQTKEDIEKVQEQMRFLGRPAIPLLAHWLVPDEIDVDYLGALAAVIAQIGGPEADKVFADVAKTQDPLFKRAVLRKLPNHARDAARPFLRDRDPSVRAWALSAVTWFNSDFLELAKDAAPDVRLVAIQRLQFPFQALSREQLPQAEEWCQSVLRLLDDPDPKVRDAARQQAAVRMPVLLVDESATARSLLLHQFDDTAMQRVGGLASDWPLYQPRFGSDELLAVARKIGPVAVDENDQPKASQRHGLLSQLVGISLKGWDRTALPAVLELAKLGLDRGWNILTPWLIRHARAEDAVAIAEHMGFISNTAPLITWFETNAKGRKDLASPIVDWLCQPSFRAHAKGQPQSSAWETWINAAAVVAALGDPASDRRLLAFTREVPLFAYDAVATAYLKSSASTAVDVLVELLDLPVDDSRLAQRGSLGFFVTRNRVFFRLARLGEPRAVDRFAGAYAHGVVPGDLRPTETDPAVLNDPSYQDGGLAWFVTCEAGFDRKPLTRYDVATVTHIFEQCLTPDAMAAWQDLSGPLRRLPQGHPYTNFRRVAIPDPVLRLLCARATEIKDTQTCQEVVYHLTVGVPRALLLETGFLQRCLRHAQRDVRMHALGCLGKGAVDRSFVPDLVALLPGQDVEQTQASMHALTCTGDPAVLEHFKPLLRHENPKVRPFAATCITRVAPDQALELLAPMLTDPDFGVRAQFCTILGGMLDRRAAPLLLARLRDPDDGVRKAAKAALEAIEFYDEQSRRVAQGGGGASTAQQLLAQADAKVDKKTRLLAIASLGALGAGDALPRLIDLTKDGDAEIANAAEAALQKILAK